MFLLIDSHNLTQLLNRKGEKEEVTAKFILIAVGGRP